MKFNVASCTMAFLTAVFVFSNSVRAGDDSANNGPKPEPIREAEPQEARTLLEQGKVSGVFPKGMVIRLGACLGESDKNENGKPDSEGMSEMWEFNSNQVHRVKLDYKKDEVFYQRIESRPFDAKGICKDLLDGKAIEIHARKGQDPNVGFVGTHYHRGSRSIEVVWNGKTILDLNETNGPFLDLYRESDARAFGALYEKLANQARELFKAKAAEAK